MRDRLRWRAVAQHRRLRDLGCAKLNLQVRTTNVDVVTFYERLGFGIDDVVSLGRRLTPADE